MARTATAVPYAARAVVLRVRTLGEKDRVMTLLSPERGKFDAAARGSRGGKSKLRAVSQPFVLARFLLAHGRSLDIATQAEIENAHIHISSDLLKTAWATYCCEVCDALPDHLPDAELFDLLCVTLEALDTSVATPPALEIVGRWFETHFLAILGYPPTLGRCVACGEKIVVESEDTTARVAFSASSGGTLCARCAPRDANRLNVNVQALRALHRLERSTRPPQGEELALTTTATRDLGDCLRRSLALHLDVRLKSQRFLDDIIADATSTQTLA